MESLSPYRRTFLIEGILFFILGLLAVALPTLSTFSFELLIGCLLLIGGAIQLYRAFRHKREGADFFSSLLVGGLYVLFGGLLLAFPLLGVLSLTILLTAFFITEGIAKLFLGIQLKPMRHWGWLLVNGFLSLLLAAVILSGWPETALWVLGLLVGINLMCFGIALLFLYWGSRE